MRNRKPKPVHTFPVMDGAGPAPREDQIAGIVQRVWAEGKLYHSDIGTLLRDWLGTQGCIVEDDEFLLLLTKARGEFTRVAMTTEEDEAPHCPAHDVVACLYWDVQHLERTGPTATPGLG